MSKRTPKSVKASCDRLFSKIVRSRGGCEKCGEKRYEQLHCAHIYSRKFGSVRFNELNALCLCAKCHRFFHDEPIEFGDFVEYKYGPRVLNDLAGEKNMIIKRKLTDWLELEKELKEKLKYEN